MDFQLTEEQGLLTDSIKRYLENEYSFDKRKVIADTPLGMSQAVWQQLAEMGLMSIPVPEAHGGFGGGAVDMMGPMQAIGASLVLEPVVPTVVLGAGLIARAGSPDQQASLLPAVSAGEVKLAFAHSEEGARYSVASVKTKAVAQGTQWMLQGKKSVVLGAPQADHIIVSARTSGSAGDAHGISLFLVDAKAPGMVVTAYRTQDDLLAADIEFNGVVVGESQRLSGQPVGEGLAAIQATLDFANAMLCAEAVGAMDSANKATLDYIKTRKQFGVPIGAFQALQHRMVDMTMEAEQARSMMYLACTSVDPVALGSPAEAAERSRKVAAAKVRVADAARKVSQEAIQLHGGMGMTQELMVSHTFRKLTVLARRFGDADHHLGRFAALAESR
jgi:alkylation response protein AidB-like acyl-CoA dehydrogenase